MTSVNPRCAMVFDASTIDNDIPQTHQLGGDEEVYDKHVPQRRSLRRKIPYVESFAEQVSRELWEKHPFRSTEHVVDSIIGSGGDSPVQRDEFQPILSPISLESEFPSPSGYEDSFDLIYTCAEDGNVHSYGGAIGANCNTEGILGTASITTSPFARIADDHETRKEKLKNFCLRVAYRGDAFCGWQTQLHNTEQPSVQRTLEEWLTELQNDQPLDAETNAKAKKARRNQKQEGKAGKLEKSGNDVSSVFENSTQNTSKSKKQSQKQFRWADLPVAGRTDSGVSAIGQLCRFRTHRKDLTAQSISEFLDDKVRSTPTISGSLSVTETTPVTKAFHPTFTTSCRAYIYLIDIGSSGEEISRNSYDVLEGNEVKEQVVLLDAMLRTIEGKTLDYIGLSYGKVKTTNTLCTLHHARARWVEFQSPADSQSRKAVCIELVGDRFLRRMVRLLVEASMRLVAEATTKPVHPIEGAKLNKANGLPCDEEDPKGALLRLIEEQDRTLVGRPAPPNGLIFVAARVQSDG